MTILEKLKLYREKSDQRLPGAGNWGRDYWEGDREFGRDGNGDFLHLDYGDYRLYIFVKTQNWTIKKTEFYWI